MRYLLLALLLVGCSDDTAKKSSASNNFTTQTDAGTDQGQGDANVVIPPGCGDGMLATTEVCDGQEVPSTCGELNRGTGELKCLDTCVFDVSGCEIAASCGAPACHEGAVITCDASGAVVETACEDRTACNAGTCIDVCAAAELAQGHEGCFFMGAQFRNSQGGPGSAFLVQNASPFIATVDFKNETSGETQQARLQSGDLTVFEIEEDLAVISISSDTPVSAYQVNAPGNISSQDSSLLLPKHLWGTKSFVSTWDDSGFMAVLSDVANSATTTSHGGSAIPAKTMWFLEEPALAGTEVTTTAPALVFGGDACTPVITAYCDHLESVMFPSQLLGVHHVVGPYFEGETNVPQGIQIVGSVDGTSVEVEGDSPQTFTLAAGEAKTLEYEDGITGVEITASAPVQVTQFIGAGRSPSMTVIPAETLWRTEYDAIGLPDATGTFQIIAPANADVTVNGIALTAFEPVDANYKIAQVEIPEMVQAKIIASEPVQVVVYGFESYASYMHLAGLKVR